MKVRPGYKHTEVGVIPGDWEVSGLQQVCREPITYGIVQCGPHVSDGVPYIRVSDMDAPELSLEGMLRTAKSIASKFARSTVEKGDLVYALRGKIGEVRQVREELVGANLTQGTARLSPNDRLISDYLVWAMRDPRTVRQAELEAKGTTFREITLADLRRIRVLVPPKPEQRAIAAALSDVDALLAGLDRLIAKKCDLKQAAMQQLLTGQTRLPGFSGEWEVKRLDELGSCFAGGTPSTTRPEYWGGDVLWLPSGRVQNNILGTPADSEIRITPKGLAESAAKRIKPPSVLVAITGATCANVALLNFEAAANQSVVAVEPIDGTNANFLYYSLLMERRQILSLQSGSAQGGVNLKTVKGLTIRCPPLSEQTAIAAVLSDMDAELAALEARRDKTRDLKQAMMQELLTGRTRLI